jgi:hypothetical protein
VIDFAVFIVILREIFLEYIQSTTEKDIKDLKKMWCLRGICQDSDSIPCQFSQNLLGAMWGAIIAK